MTRNDRFYKILFAIQIALLPLAIAVYMLKLPTWSIALFVTGILVVKIWMVLFKDKENHIHSIIDSIGNAFTISTLTIFLTSINLVESVTLCVFVVMFVVLMNLFKVLLCKTKMPEMIDAVDACFGIFEYLTLIAFILVATIKIEQITVFVNIALFALLLTSAVSIAYKTFYSFRTYDILGKIKNFFAKLFRRR